MSASPKFVGTSLGGGKFCWAGGDEIPAGRGEHGGPRARTILLASETPADILRALDVPGTAAEMRLVALSGRKHAIALPVARSVAELTAQNAARSTAYAERCATERAAWAARAKDVAHRASKIKGFVFLDEPDYAALRDRDMFLAMRDDGGETVIVEVRGCYCRAATDHRSITDEEIEAGVSVWLA